MLCTMPEEVWKSRGGEIKEWRKCWITPFFTHFSYIKIDRCLVSNSYHREQGWKPGQEAAIKKTFSVPFLIISMWLQMIETRERYRRVF